MSNVYDITGKKYGLLTALYPTGESYKKSRVWRCLCTCGQVIDVNVKTLEAGEKTHCGCQYIDITGQRFSHLLVIKQLSRGSCLCKCDCGNEIVSKTYKLTSGHRKSCGCLKRHPEIGQVFGHLTVTGRAKNGWRCRCDCGNERIISAYNLFEGNYKSCGCDRGHKTLDLTNQTFYYLTAIERCGKRGSHNLWRCRCRCGKEVVVDIGDLRSGHTKSCGCIRGKANIKDLTGMQFGRLTVIEMCPDRKGKKLVWKCRCSCGNTTNVTASDLTTGHTKSCGCLRKERYNNSK